MSDRQEPDVDLDAITRRATLMAEQVELLETIDDGEPVSQEEAGRLLRGRATIPDGGRRALPAGHRIAMVAAGVLVVACGALFQASCTPAQQAAAGAVIATVDAAASAGLGLYERAVRAGAASKGQSPDPKLLALAKKIDAAVAKASAEDRARDEAEAAQIAALAARLAELSPCLPVAPAVLPVADAGSDASAEGGR